MNRKELKPCKVEISKKIATIETNNNKLHKTGSYVNKEGHKTQSEKAKDDTDTSQAKSMKPNTEDKVKKSKNQKSGQSLLLRSQWNMHNTYKANSRREQKLS